MEKIGIVPVILCGGAGARLWPLSRENSPKQFINLVDGQSLFDAALARAKGLENGHCLICVTVDEHTRLVGDSLKRHGVEADVLVEPARRNTAAAICATALWIMEQYGDAVMAVLPCDHFIKQENQFFTAIGAAAGAARDGYWAMLGIPPDGIVDRFGYIRAGDRPEKGNGYYRVEEFVEKPDGDQAGKLVRAGWFWNAGVFVVKASVVGEAIKACEPAVYQACFEAMGKAKRKGRWILPDQNAYRRCPSRQIDKAVLEQHAQTAVVPFYGVWRDVGSFEALAGLCEQTGPSNRVSGRAVIENGDNVFVHSPHRLTVALGVKDLTIIDTPDALLIADKSCVDQVGSILGQIEKDHPDQVRNHQRVVRPWGWYDVIFDRPGYKVKNVMVRAGGCLSSQFHYHRSEHWIVVEGTATITLDGEKFDASSGQNVFVPQGVIHRLENQTEQSLELVEVQTGSLLSEEDIVRVEDAYGRCKLS
jgi:mannose-1-phosphate guanylyltransferase/mannose-6-phosphate isomerase